MKIIDTKQYLDNIKDYDEISIPVVGNSMRPCLNGNDYVYLKKCKGYKRGDIVLFQRNNGQYILHRIHHIKNNIYYVLGDNQLNFEQIQVQQILSKVIKIKRNNKWIHENIFYKKIYICMPIRKLIVSVIKCLKSI